EHDVGELAIDPAGQRIAMRLDGPYGEVQEISVRDLLEASQPEAAAVSAITPEPVAPVVASVALPPVAAAPRDPFQATRTLDRLDALPRRPVHARATADEDLAWLAAQRERALGWVTLAIARAWDQGRIAFPNMSALPF